MANLANPADHYSMLDGLPDGVLVIRNNSKIEFANGAFMRVLGWQRDDIVEHPILDIVAPGDMMHLVGFESIFGTGLTQCVTVLFATSEGSSLPLVVSSAHAEDLSRTYLVARDSGTAQEELAATSRWAAEEQDRADEISKARDALAATNAELRATQDALESAFSQLQDEVAARAKLERELRLAQKLEAVGRLAAGVAHEINTPIQYLTDNVNFLEKTCQRFISHIDDTRALLVESSVPELHDVASKINAMASSARLEYLRNQVPKAITAARQGAAHISNIVRAMKAFASAEQSQKTYSDLNEAIRNTLVVAQGEYNAHANVKADLGDLPPLLCYIGKLNQVFLNIIVNAAHAIAAAKRTEPGLIQVKTRLNDAAVEISIRDNGCGIPESIQDRVFDQFFTTKEVGQGTGTGLSEAYSIVVLGHGGTLTFRSEVDVGTEFTIRLPVDGKTRLLSLAP